MTSDGTEERVREHSFVTLIPHGAGTAAMKIPFLMWQDTINGPEHQGTNYHRDFCSLYIVRRGSGFHVIDQIRYAVARGDVYAMGPGMSHYFEGCDRLVTDTFHFVPTLFDPETRDALSQTPGFHALFVTDPSVAHGDVAAAGATRERWLHLTPTQHAVTLGLTAELLAEWRSGSAPTTILLTRALFFRLLVRLSRCHAENVDQSSLAGRATPPLAFAGSHEATIAGAVRFMEERFPQPLRIGQIAAQVFLSPDRFTGVFSEVMGRTPRDYLHHLRIEHAKMLMVTTDLPMSQIASASGFHEAAYFTRVIRSATGMSPTEFRRGAPNPAGESAGSRPAAKPRPTRP